MRDFVQLFDIKCVYKVAMYVLICIVEFVSGLLKRSTNQY